jgi:Glycosyl transferases group 1
MRVFQNSGLDSRYLEHFNRLDRQSTSFLQRRSVFLNDRYGACHFLLPIDKGHEEAFFTNGDDIVLQKMWAIENKMPSSATPEQILLAQIEHHRAEIFYNLDPMRYGSSFVRKLPGCVKKTVAWRAAPSNGGDFVAYDLIVCNFPSILKHFASMGCRTEYFSPSHDPIAKTYANDSHKPIDILFVGGYTRHHSRRNTILDHVAALRHDLNIVYCLNNSRITRLAESFIGRFLPLRRYRRPLSIAAISHAPVFGRDMYKLIAQAKIVLNSAIDMSNDERGNMRCFETLSCGSLLLSDGGIYPEGMVNQSTIITYDSTADLVNLIPEILKDHSKRLQVASAGNKLISEKYSKEVQWSKFVDLVG